MRPDRGPGTVRDPETDERLLGAVDGAEPGPHLVALGCLHGNEPAGAAALSRVLEAIGAERYALRGRFAALLGNPAARRARERYVDADLNRLWTRERVRLIRSGHGDPAVSEERDVLALLRRIGATLEGAVGGSHLMDLHTTSGDSAPFLTVPDTPRNRTLAATIPLPIVLGLDVHLDGTLLSHYTAEGQAAIGLEGGRHDDPASVDRLEAGVWLALAGTGILVDPRANARLAAARALLSAAGGGLPRVMEVRHRYPVRPTDRFVMRPGYRSFQPVAAGTVLADGADGPIPAPMDGFLLMPRYQRSGDDGFFIMRAAGLRGRGAAAQCHTGEDRPTKPAPSATGVVTPAQAGVQGRGIERRQPPPS